MNMNQHFDNHIKNQFEDYTPQVHPRIWENIIKEREKKRPAGFWRQLFNRRNILLLACLVAAGGGALLLLNTSTGTKERNTEAAAAVTTIPNSLSGSNDVSADGIVVTEKNNAPQTGVVNKPVADNDVGNAIAGRQIAISTLSNYTTKRTTAVNSNANNNNKPSYKKAQLTADARQKIRVKNGAAFTDSDDANVETVQDYELPFMFYTAQRNTAEKTTVGLAKPKLANIIDPGCPSIEKNAAGNKTYVEVYGGPDYAFKNLSDTGNSVYLQKRKESTKFSAAFSVGMRYTKVFSNGVSIRTGINYSQINEKFIYSEGNIIQLVYIINANGDTIGSYTNTGSRFKTTHNKFRTIDVPLVLGYEMGNGKLHTNINAGVIINAYSWQKGEVLDNNLRPVNITTGKSNSLYQFKTNIGVGFLGSVSFYYKLNEKLHIMAEPYFRYNLTPASKEEITFKQKYNTAGLRFGLRLDLR